MFGSNDKNQPDNTPQANDVTAAALPVAPPPEDSLVTAPPDPVIMPTAPPLNDSMTPLPTEPVLPPQPEPPTIISSSSKTKVPDAPSAPPPTVPVNADGGELLDIKQQALHSLAPLVHQLEQTPEEKFKTTMMLIQASDNASLIRDAHEAANAIPDEKARAQALLDVVNEINYFTQHQNQEQN
ncbi:MAG: hypothetical protein WEC17_02670 [Candidatus Saccharimonadales bacterium]